MVDDLADLEQHYLDVHAMKPFDAKRKAALEGRQNGNGHRKVPMLAETPEHHCPKCGEAFACDWQMIAQMRQHAARLRMIAAKWEEKQQGRALGKARKNPEWTTEEARALVAAGLSFRAAGKLLGANGETVKRAIVEHHEPARQA